jgi:hypothetical protein
VIARAVVAGFASLALLAFAQACTEDTVVLASIPADDAGGPPPTPTRCASKDDCDDGNYCAKDSCTAELGTCTPFPAVCTGDVAPVCGCDDVTYFNDCVRQGAGIAFSTPNECEQNTVPCGGPDHKTCASGQTCALLLGPAPHSCGPDSPGRCWVLPASCPTSSSDTNRWVPCEPPPQQAPPPDTWCVDTCHAISSGEPHFRVNQCP